MARGRDRIPVDRNPGSRSTLAHGCSAAAFWRGTPPIRLRPDACAQLIRVKAPAAASA